MATVPGTATTFNVENLRGELYHLTPFDTPFLSMAGGITGGATTNSVEFGWTTDSNPSAEQPEILEGVDPIYESRDRVQITNVTQTFQYGFSATYKKMSATGQFSASNAPDNLQTNAVTNELMHQQNLKLKRMARDVEYTFLNGSYQKPTDNTQAYKTRGILEAITTNTLDAGGDDLTKTDIDTIMRTMVDNDAQMGMGTLTVFCNSYNRQRFSSIYAYAPESRTFGGVKVDRILTDFGDLNIVFDRYMPADTLLFADMSIIRPVHMNVPGRGTVFVEQKPATGSAWNFMLYGEVGLEYGPEKWHSTITNTATS